MIRINYLSEKLTVSFVTSQMLQNSQCTYTGCRSADYPFTIHAVMQSSQFQMNTEQDL